jgi:hypothetical protein
MFNKLIKIYIVAVLFLISGCSQFRADANDKFVKKLNSQIRAENFEQIYNDFSLNVKESVSKQEFIERMQIVVGRMKEIDETLIFRLDDRVSFDNGLFHAENFAYRHIKKNGEELGINFEIDSVNGELKLKDICVFSLNEYLLEDSKFSMCTTNAKSKI